MHPLVTSKTIPIIDRTKVSVGDVVKVTFYRTRNFPTRKWFYHRKDIATDKFQAYGVVRDVYENSVCVLMAEFQDENNESFPRFDYHRDFDIHASYLNNGSYDLEVVLRRNDLF